MKLTSIRSSFLRAMPNMTSPCALSSKRWTLVISQPKHCRPFTWNTSSFKSSSKSATAATHLVTKYCRLFTGNTAAAHVVHWSPNTAVYSPEIHHHHFQHHTLYTGRQTLPFVYRNYILIITRCVNTSNHIVQFVHLNNTQRFVFSIDSITTSSFDYGALSKSSTTIRDSGIQKNKHPEASDEKWK